ncbi:hypothetical protein R1flu_026907 [Riccia fluitans]|uniref:Nicastrin n=1 Tax=Riccia fluitans TaxID=41844 RepID=A0ABD1XH91_9MARC
MNRLGRVIGGLSVMKLKDSFVCGIGVEWSGTSGSALSRLIVLLVLAICSGVCFGLKSVPEIENSMYQMVDGTACVRLLSIQGEVGCAGPSRKAVHAPLWYLSDASLRLSRKTTIVMPLPALHDFLNRIVNEPSLAKHVAGVLVESDVGEQNATIFSPDAKFPQAEFAPYKAQYIWNPPGSGVLQQRFNFPVFLLTPESTASVKMLIASNEKRNYEYPLHVAEFDMVMQSTKSGTHDSVSCLKEWACLPLGGYNVWSALPALNASAPTENPIVLVMAAMDSASLFRDATPGADSPLSGLIAMLAAADALSRVPDVDQFQKQIIFLAVTGEAWGYLGSRRFLRELASGNPSLSGLSMSRIHQVLEVGSVGKAVDAGRATLYFHKQKDQVSMATQQIVEALQSSASSLTGAQHVGAVEIKPASKLNPGVPPSSIMSFIQKNSSTAAVVLQEFDKVFKNPAYHSDLDGVNNIDKNSIAGTAALIARTVYLLGDSAANSTQLQSIDVNSSLVDDLVGCLIAQTPGMECDLVKGLITPTQKYANHYVGVFLGEPTSSPYLENVDDTSRFVWNFLASRTGIIRHQRVRDRDDAGRRNAFASSFEECTQKCSNADEICVGATGEHKGRCMMSTTRYLPAYSPRLTFESSGWKVVAAELDDAMSQVDPVWTESFWKAIGVRFYLKESTSQDELMLGVGTALTIGSFFAIFCTKAMFHKRLKRA